MSGGNETLLFTGSTGFIGSSLAARFLKEGKRIVALTRKDPSGIKTRSAIERGARTLGLRLPATALTDNLTVVSAPLEEAEAALGEELMRNIDTVWHNAALLSYDMGKLNDSLDVNVAATAKLYRLVSRYSPCCRRFYHVSTAYCAGLPQDDRPIPEELHPSPHKPNVYQLSKWAAEMTLRALSTESRIPVSLVRPSVVVGHSRTGAYHGEAFGIYMFFLAGYQVVKLTGVRELRLDPGTKGTVNLVPIDSLVENLHGLSRKEGPARPTFEVIHLTGTNVSSEWVARAGEKIYGIKVTFARPESEIDRRFAEAVEENRIFASHTFHFEEGRLSALLGAGRVPAVVTEPMVETLIAAYKRRLDGEHETFRQASAVSESLRGQIRDAEA